MSVPAAYLGVIIIWSTTPLAIQWSSQGWGFVFGAAGRMLIGMVFCLSLLVLINKKLSWQRQARWTYVAAGSGIYGAMLCVYWGAQYIPSGLVATVFGLTPVVTGVLAALILKESFGVTKLLGALLGITGLFIIFQSDISLSNDVWKGVCGILMAVFLHAGSAVWMKNIDAQLPALSITAGGLLFAVPLYLLTWWIVDGSLHMDYLASTAALKTGAALMYLGVFGTVIGFSLYFYVLKNIEANKVALITLVTPVLALLIGHLLNDEPVLLSVWLGAACIILAISVYQWGEQAHRLVDVFSKSS
ncbi:MAG: DMT family transporter [Gammaproteobacteria bacterium]|nr:DMT family transporter [Gammaproteobacteria bacterium]MDH5800162.1 DMT family transporter [Gammaproteobacteria bacterium]